MYTIKDLYDLNETIAAKLFEGKTYPWEVLADETWTNTSKE